MAINDDNQSLGISNKYKKDTQYGKVIFGQMEINLKINFFSIKKNSFFTSSEKTMGKTGILLKLKSHYNVMVKKKM